MCSMAGGHKNKNCRGKRKNKLIVPLLSSTVWTEQKSGSKHSLMERHIRVETLPSMQHVKALHSCDLTLYNKNHLHEGKKDKRQTEGVGWQADEDGKHQNKSINQWSRSRHKPTQNSSALRCRLHKQEAWCQKTHSCSPSNVGLSSHLECIVAEGTTGEATYDYVMLCRRLSSLFTRVDLPSSLLSSPVFPILLLHWCLHSRSPLCSVLVQKMQQW